MLQSLRQGGRSGLLLASRGGYGYRPWRPLLPAARSLCTPRPSTSLAQWLARDSSHSDGESGRAAVNPITWYACGPTVYDAAHLGHARTYVSQDVIRRVLEGHCGREVYFVMGVTDVDDKIIARARDSGEDPVALARRCEAEFWEDMRALNVRPPDAVARVTEHMDAITHYIAGIERNGLAYRTKDSGVYFDVGAFAQRFSYGKLSPSDASVQGQGNGEGEGGQQQQQEVVVGQEEKRDPRDFVLWKPAKEGEPSWPSPWGLGRPGWHIECSAMTHHLLGDRLDIHSGGVDLRFPHHTNELAQCEAFLGAEDPPWVRTWLHTGHLYIKGRKMSKSLKNFLTVRACLQAEKEEEETPQQHFFPDDFRLFCCLRRFGANADYSEEAMSEARALRRLFLNFLASAEAAQTCTSDRSKQWGPREFALQRKLGEAKKRVDGALRGGEEVDASGALRALQGLVGEGNRYLAPQQEGVVVVGEAISNVARFVSRVLSLLGLTSHEKAHGQQGKGGNGYGYATPQELAAALVEFRSRVRGAALAVAVKGEEGEEELLPRRLLAMCDEMRDGSLAGLGLVVKDVVAQGGGSSAVWRLEGKKRLPPPLGPSLSGHEQSPSPPSNAPPLRKPLAAAVRAPLQELFKQGAYAGQFSAFDAQGVPTHDAEGKEVSKRLRAKLERKWERHRLRLSAEREGGDGGGLMEGRGNE